MGRTRTTPLPGDEVAAVKLAVYSCSNYNFGFFNAFGNVARKRSVDYVLHLGDFMYEYAEGAYGWGWSIGRIPKPNAECRTLYDYRERHNVYRADLDSIESFSSFAWIPVWDDHEARVPFCGSDLLICANVNSIPGWRQYLSGWHVSSKQHRG